MKGRRYGTFGPYKCNIPELIFDTDECIIWPYSCHGSGYGSILFNGKATNAHRVSAFLAGILKDFDDPRYVCHECNVKKCINPKHLFLGTSSDNAQHAATTKVNPRSARTLCKYGHEYNKDTYRGYRVCGVCKKIRNKDNYENSKRKFAEENSKKI